MSVGLSRMVLEAFVEDVGDAIELLGEGYEDLESFGSVVHGMKSALANVGELELSGWARELEDAAESGKLDIISAKTPIFIEKLSELQRNYALMLEGDAKEAGDLKELKKHLVNLIDACDSYEDRVAKGILDELDIYKWESVVAVKLKQLRSLILVHSEFEDAIEFIKSFETEV